MAQDVFFAMIIAVPVATVAWAFIGDAIESRRNYKESLKGNR